MLVKTWRSITLTLTALNLGASFAHALEMPAKRELGASDYLTVQRIYRAFGAAGALLEPGSILSAAALAGLVRRREPAFGLTLAGAGDLAAVLAVWFSFVKPMNEKIATWPADGIPENWTRVRDQWEFAHAARFVLQLSGFAFLLASVVAETAKPVTGNHAPKPHPLASS